MWQRNDTGHVQDVAAYPTDEEPSRHPFTVGPGEVVDFPMLLAGFTETEAPALAESTDDASADSAAAGADESGAKKTTRKRAAAAADPEGE